MTTTISLTLKSHEMITQMGHFMKKRLVKSITLLSKLQPNTVRLATTRVITPQGTGSGTGFYRNALDSAQKRLSIGDQSNNGLFNVMP